MLLSVYAYTEEIELDIDYSVRDSVAGVGSYLEFHSVKRHGTDILGELSEYELDTIERVIMEGA